MKPFLTHRRGGLFVCWEGGLDYEPFNNRLPIPEELLDVFPFPSRVVSGASAAIWMDRLRDDQPQLYPVLIGDYDSVDRLADGFLPEHDFFYADPETAIAAAEQDSMTAFMLRQAARETAPPPQTSTPIEGQVMLTEFRNGQTEIHSPSTWEDYDAAIVHPSLSNPPRGPWPEVETPSDEAPILEGVTDILTGQPFHQVAIAQIPVDAGWKVFAHLRFGGFHACPRPEVHCMLAREWGEAFGARVMTVKDDMVEYFVDRPPETREAALELALQHYASCPILLSPEAPLETYAAGLMARRHWFFWWS